MGNCFVPCGIFPWPDPARVDVRVGGLVMGWMAGCSDLHNKDFLIVDVHNKDVLNDEPRLRIALFLISTIRIPLLLISIIKIPL